MEKSILVVGDYIADVYIDGPVDKANEGGGRRISTTRTKPPEVRRGGAAFVRDALSAFSGLKVLGDYSSSSTITRYRDTKTKETLLTVDEVGPPMFHGHNINRSHTFDALVVWDDDRLNKNYGWHWAFSSLPPNALVVVDSKNVTRWDIPAVSYIKMTSSDWNGVMPKNGAQLILTKANAVSQENAQELYPVNCIENPVDTCGAGDVFTAVFVTKLLEGATESEAITEAIRYSTESVNHHGCVIPNRE